MLNNFSSTIIYDKESLPWECRFFVCLSPQKGTHSTKNMYKHFLRAAFVRVVIFYVVAVWQQQNKFVLEPKFSLRLRSHAIDKRMFCSLVLWYSVYWCGGGRSDLATNGQFLKISNDVQTSVSAISISKLINQLQTLHHASQSDNVLWQMFNYTLFESFTRKFFKFVNVFSWNMKGERTWIFYDLTQKKLLVAFHKKNTARLPFPGIECSLFLSRWIFIYST